MVVLRAMTVGDAAALVAGEDGDIRDRLAAGPFTVATAEAYIRDRAGERHRGEGPLAWGITDAATEVLAGRAEVALRHPGLPPGTANLTYAVFPGWRGRRFGARAVELMCGFLSRETTISTAVLRIDADNAASLRVAEDSGFRRSPELAGANASMLWFARTLPR